MKNIVIICSILFFAAVSCNKSEDNLKTERNNQNSESINLKSESIEKIYSYTCTGICAGGDECSMTLYVQQNHLECDCEGCALIVTVETPDGGTQQVAQQELIDKLFERELYLTELTSFIKEEYNTDEYKITSIELVEYGEDYYLLYDFTTNNGLSESLMFASVQPNGEDPVTYRVDCTGDCNADDKTCREIFNFNPPSAECTCEGPCGMDIQQL